MRFLFETDPNINIFRDPRWGRGQEVPGEDPWLNSRYGVQFVRGMEGDDARYLKLSTTCKHWDAYSLEKWGGVDRHHFNAIVSDYDLNDTYLVPIKYCVSPDAVYGGRASGVMCSYNELNGVPSCANRRILTDLLSEWGFSGYVTSDCSAVRDVLNAHHYTTTPGETCSAVFSSGMDLECGSFTASHGVDAINEGSMAFSDLQHGLIADYTVLMRLGLFDDPQAAPWKGYGPEMVNTARHQQIALEAVQQSIVMLKNTQNTLPFDVTASKMKRKRGKVQNLGNIKNIAVFGPNANATDVQGGNYNGRAPLMVSTLDAVKSYAAGNGVEVLYHEGVGVNSTDTAHFGIAMEYAAKSELTVFVMGLNHSIEAEGTDRYDLHLPGLQNEFVANVSSVAGGDVVLVIVSGGCVDISRFEGDGNVGAILWGGYGGMFAGQGVADVLFGAVNPSALTTQTWYRNGYVDEVSMLDMGMRPSDGEWSGLNASNPGRGYRYYGGSNVLYPFGHGLSFTRFGCSGLRVNEEDRTLSVEVENTGNAHGGAVVLVYWVPTDNGTDGRPIKRLAAFGKVDVAVRATKGLDMLIYEQFYWSDEYQSGDGQFELGGACNS